MLSVREIFSTVAYQAGVRLNYSLAAAILYQVIDYRNYASAENPLAASRKVRPPGGSIGIRDLRDRPVARGRFWSAVLVISEDFVLRARIKSRQRIDTAQEAIHVDLFPFGFVLSRVVLHLIFRCASSDYRIKQASIRALRPWHLVGEN